MIVGDKVRIDRTLDNSCWVGGEMNSWDGKIGTISKIEVGRDNGQEIRTFSIEEDRCGFSFPIECAIPIRDQHAELTERDYCFLYDVIGQCSGDAKILDKVYYKLGQIIGNNNNTEGDWDIRQSDTLLIQQKEEIHEIDVYPYTPKEFTRSQLESLQKQIEKALG